MDGGPTEHTELWVLRDAGIQASLGAREAQEWLSTAAAIS